MNHYFDLLLQWARGSRVSRDMATGWILRDESSALFNEPTRLDVVERMYLNNVIKARDHGVAA